MSFQQGLSGLNASSKNLDVIGNNVANANTYGAKASRAEFSDMYATAMTGGGGSNIGIGVNLAAVTQQFTQGNITTTANSLDLAINGQGFFEVRAPDGQTLYSRNGQFQGFLDLVARGFHPACPCRSTAVAPGSGSGPARAAACGGRGRCRAIPCASP